MTSKQLVLLIVVIQADFLVLVSYLSQKFREMGR